MEARKERGEKTEEKLRISEEGEKEEKTWERGMKCGCGGGGCVDGSAVERAFMAAGEEGKKEGRQAYERKKSCLKRGKKKKRSVLYQV